MRAKPKNLASIMFRCTTELHEQAEKLSDLTMIPMSVMCRQALTEYIKTHSVGIVLGNAEPQVQHRLQKPMAQKRREPDLHDLHIRRLVEERNRDNEHHEPILDQNGEVDDWL